MKKRIFFGNYPYSRDGSKKPLEWFVLREFSGGTALLLSKYCVDCIPYNEKYEPVSWEICTMRRWLNYDFLNAAFSNEEQRKIIVSENENNCNPEHGTKGCVITFDKIFCLSIDEAKKYLPIKEVRRAKATPYAKNKGAFISGCKNRDSCCWYLRSPGGTQKFAADIEDDGSISNYGFHVDIDWCCVRPALRINF